MSDALVSLRLSIKADSPNILCFFFSQSTKCQGPGFVHRLGAWQLNLPPVAAAHRRSRRPISMLACGAAKEAQAQVEPSFPPTIRVARSLGFFLVDCPQCLPKCSCTCQPGGGDRIECTTPHFRFPPSTCTCRVGFFFFRIRAHRCPLSAPPSHVWQDAHMASKKCDYVCAFRALKKMYSPLQNMWL